MSLCASGSLGPVSGSSKTSIAPSALKPSIKQGEVSFGPLEGFIQQQTLPTAPFPTWTWMPFLRGRGKWELCQHPPSPGLYQP